MKANVKELFPVRIVRVGFIPIRWPGRTYNIDTLGYKVQYVNFLTKNERERTKISDTVGHDCASPGGLHVFQKICPVEVLTAATDSLKELFRLVERDPALPERSAVEPGDLRFQMRPYLGRGSTNNILFIQGDAVVEGETTRPEQPKFADCMFHVQAYDVRLHDFILEHAKLCLHIMDVGEEALSSCQLQLIHYSIGGGILAHIDSIAAFRETIGPIFTVNMDIAPKAFDLLPTLLPRPQGAVRLTTTHGQVTMMDAASRLLWSHSIPYDNPTDCYTIAFKFPCMDRYLADTSGGFSRILGVHIPQNLREGLRRGRR